MTLQAIIIRADGALAETEDVRRRAFAQVFTEAGFDWSCDREGFALTAKLGSGIARMSLLVCLVEGAYLAVHVRRTVLVLAREVVLQVGWRLRPDGSRAGW